MDLKLQGKHILITGGSKGIGFATAESFAREGANLILVARSKDALQTASDRLCQDHGISVETVCVDLSTPDGVATVASAVSSIDVLVNNAGAIPPGSLMKVGAEAWRRGWDLKVNGYIDLTRALYDKLPQPGGVIVNIIGSAGENPNKDYICGSTGNAALMMFTKAFARDARTDGVRVVGINPGPVMTERFQMLLEAEAERRFTDRARWEELMADLPFGRAATPREIADAAAFLASTCSAYTSGSIVTIDGAL